LILGGVATARVTLGHASASTADATELAPLTSNSVEAPVMAAVLSPDGATIAYSEKRGIFLRGARRGATSARLLAPIAATSMSFAPDGGSLVVVLTGGRAARVSVADGAVTALDVGRADALAISPDGTRLAVVDSNVLSLVDVKRPGERRELRRFDGVQQALDWSPSGKSLLFGFIEMSDVVGELVAIDVATGRSRTVLRDRRLVQEVGTLAAAFSGEERVVAAYAPTRTEDGVLRELTLGGTPVRDVARLGRTPISDLHLAADRSRLAFVRYVNQTDVYVADFAAEGTLSPLRRVTLSNDNERPSDFTTDGQLLMVVDSQRAYRAMRLDPETGISEPLVDGTAWTTWPTALPTGGVAAFLLDERRPGAADVSLVSTGGASRSLAPELSVLGRGRPPPYDRALRCSAGRCVLVTKANDGVVLSDVDPRTLSIAPGPTIGDLDPSWGFALSSDGEAIAIRSRPRGDLAIVSPDGERLGEVAAPEGCFVQFAAFTAHDRALVATMVCSSKDAYQVHLLSRDGAPSRTLVTSGVAWFSHPVVSRDGKRLALSEMPLTSNVYVADLPR
jgi:Tol biopolymer transport system component